LAQFARDIRIAQQTCDARQRLKMIGTGSFRREQQKHEIDRLAVERLELYGPFEAGKKSEQFVQLGQLAVGNGDAVAYAGRTKLLALLQRFQDRLLTLAAEFGSLGG